MQQALARNAEEVSGAPKTTNGQGMGDVEMSPLPSRRNADREIKIDNTPAGRALSRREGRREAELDERVREAARALFPAPVERKKTDPAYLMSDDLDDRGRPGVGVAVAVAGDESGRSGSTSTGSVASGTTMVGAKPQVVRSMLDI